MKPYSFEHLKQPDGTYETPDGISHSSAEDFICSALGFCGCGCPDKALHFVHAGIKLLVHDLTAIRERVDFGTPEGQKLWHVLYKEWEQEVRKLFPTVGAEFFFLYWLDKHDFTEHGGSVSGSWLTETGQTLWNDLEIFVKEEEEVQD